MFDRREIDDRSVNTVQEDPATLEIATDLDPLQKVISSRQSQEFALGTFRVENHSPLARHPLVADALECYVGTIPETLTSPNQRLFKVDVLNGCWDSGEEETFASISRHDLGILVHLLLE